jgi:hypothetical protein
MTTQQDNIPVAFTKFQMAPCEDWSDWSQFYTAFNELAGYILDMQAFIEKHPDHKGSLVKCPQLDKTIHYTPNMEKALDLLEEDMKKYVPGFQGMADIDEEEEA